MSFEAIARTAIRLLITGRGLLEWRTAHDVQRTACTNIFGFYRVMGVLPLTAAAGAVAVGICRPDAIWAAAGRARNVAHCPGDRVLA